MPPPLRDRVVLATKGQHPFQVGEAPLRVLGLKGIRPALDAHRPRKAVVGQAAQKGIQGKPPL